MRLLASSWVLCLRKINYAEAVQFYRLAAEQGYSLAQFALSDCFYHGRGATRDTTEALRWCRLSAEQGHENAQKELQKVSCSLQ